jgi:hypothetical protein
VQLKTTLRITIEINIFHYQYIQQVKFTWKYMCIVLDNVDNYNKNEYFSLLVYSVMLNLLKSICMQFTAILKILLEKNIFQH